MSREETSTIILGVTPDALIESVVQRLLGELTQINQVPVQEELLTCQEVEAKMDISHQTRINYTKQGILKSYTLGGRKIYYKLSEIINSLIKIDK